LLALTVITRNEIFFDGACYIGFLIEEDTMSTNFRETLVQELPQFLPALDALVSRPTLIARVMTALDKRTTRDFPRRNVPLRHLYYVAGYALCSLNRSVDIEIKFLKHINDIGYTGMAAENLGRELFERHKDGPLRGISELSKIILRHIPPEDDAMIVNLYIYPEEILHSDPRRSVSTIDGFRPCDTFIPMLNPGDMR
jgi:hypothetical protein